MRTVPTIDENDAKKAMKAALEEAKLQGTAIVVAIVDMAGFLMAFVRQDGVRLADIDMVINDARNAALAGVGLDRKQGHVMPLMHGDDVIGMIAVSSGSFETGAIMSAVHAVMIKRRRKRS